MRTKTAVLCAAAMAAGVASSWAQSNVYSLNIVGYANVPVGNQFNLLSNPFDTTPNDSATNVFPNPGAQGGTYSGPWDNSVLQTWTGIGFAQEAFDSETSDTPTGFQNPTTLASVPAPTLGSGIGFYLFNQANNTPGTLATNVTFVGQVRTGTNAIVYPVSPHLYFIGSPLPLAGGVSSVLGFANPGAQGGSYSGPLDNSVIEQAAINGSGQITGYIQSAFDSETSDTTTGFQNPTTLASVPQPVIPIGGGFVFFSQANNEGSTAYTWTQILLP